METIGSQLLARNDWIGKIATAWLEWYEGRCGPVYARRGHKRALAVGRSIKMGLEEIKARWPDVVSPAQEKPVFILSAGWRSGSTLVQRLVMSGQSILIWGEPYSHARILRHLAGGVSAINAEWPKDEWFVDQYNLDELSNKFVANMYPMVQDLLLSSLAYTRTLFDEPALKKGFQRWGLKEVRLTIDDAYFLRWLYPKARFIFLCRNPYDAYRSYRLDRSWYNEWPYDPVFTADRFGRHWRDLVEGFQNGYKDVGAVFMRYEDLCSGGSYIELLEEYLELELESGLLKKKVGSHRKNGDSVSRTELKMLRGEVANLARSLGYNK